jgi:hypothetical protein
MIMGLVYVRLGWSSHGNLSRIVAAVARSVRQWIGRVEAGDATKRSQVQIGPVLGGSGEGRSCGVQAEPALSDLPYSAQFAIVFRSAAPSRSSRFGFFRVNEEQLFKA